MSVLQSCFCISYVEYQQCPKVEEYVTTVKRITKHNMEERLTGMQREDMKEIFKPVLESNEEMAKGIAQDLVPIREELETLIDTIKNRQNRIQSSTLRKLPELPMDSHDQEVHQYLKNTTLLLHPT